MCGRDNVHGRSPKIIEDGHEMLRERDDTEGQRRAAVSAVGKGDRKKRREDV